jgi:hypothetical protein
VLMSLECLPRLIEVLQFRKIKTAENKNA